MIWWVCGKVWEGIVPLCWGKKNPHSFSWHFWETDCMWGKVRHFLLKEKCNNMSLGAPPAMVRTHGSRNGEALGQISGGGTAATSKKNLLYGFTGCGHLLVMWPPYQGLWIKPLSVPHSLQGGCCFSVCLGTDAFSSPSWLMSRGCSWNWAEREALSPLFFFICLAICTGALCSVWQ